MAGFYFKVNLLCFPLSGCGMPSCEGYYTPDYHELTVETMLAVIEGRTNAVRLLSQE